MDLLELLKLVGSLCGLLWLLTVVVRAARPAFSFVGAFIRFAFIFVFLSLFALLLITLLPGGSP